MKEQKEQHPWSIAKTQLLTEIKTDTQLDLMFYKVCFTYEFYFHLWMYCLYVCVKPWWSNP